MVISINSLVKICVFFFLWSAIITIVRDFEPPFYNYSLESSSFRFRVAFGKGNGLTAKTNWHCRDNDRQSTTQPL